MYLPPSQRGFLRESAELPQRHSDRPRMGMRCRNGSGWGLLLLALSFAAATFASRPDPTSKFYVLGLSGSAEMRSTDRIEALQGKSLHNAQGTTLTTGSGSSNTVVFSNGTAMFFAAETRIDVTKFRQSPLDRKSVV